jgi:hypothetical protein
MTIPQWVIVVLLIAMLSGHIAFAYRYMKFSPWRSTWQGITLLAQTVTLAALAAFYIIDTFAVGSWPGRMFFVISFLVALATEAWVATFCLVHVQRSQEPVSEKQGTGYVHKDEINKE